MLDRTVLPIVQPGRLRALFDEAWRRARRRRLLVAAALIVAVAVAVAVAVGQSARDRPAPVAPPPPPAALALPKDPGMGVACPEANSIGAVTGSAASPSGWTPSRSDWSRASAGGRWCCATRTSGAARTRPRFHQAMLQPAGLLDGALKVTPDEGRYHSGSAGTPSWDAHHHRHLPRRQPAVATRRVPLAPGWG